MMIDPEHAPATADYLGKKYWFCQESEHAQFVADPAKYVSVVRIQRWSGAGAFVVTIDPGSPAVGTEVRLRALFAPRKGDGVDESSPVELKDAVVHFYDVDRDHAPREVAVRLQPVSGRIYGALHLAEREEETRFVVEATTAAGDPVRLIGSFKPVAAPPPAPEDRPFDMARQHEVMRRFGREWLALGVEIEKEKPDRAAIAASVGRIEDERKRLPQFMLHVNEEDKPEFVRYGEDLAAPLAALGALGAKGDYAGVRAQMRKLDEESCLKCHLKFRWDIVRDLSRFPRVEPAK
ncbi:MAG: hypothetical protein K8T20_03165 [Planctomycetes bacterium]|nr:hypothetical protein [Planctomycetota bacterium]